MTSAPLSANFEAKSVGLARLDLTDFRNHAAVSLSIQAKIVVLTGPNGAGKTNVLEAISMLVPGRGLRRAALPEMARQGGSGGFSIHARLAEGDLDLGTGVTADAPGRRQVRIQGAKASPNDLAQWMTVHWLTPAMDRLFVDGASERRRFLDRMVLGLDPAHARRSSAYEAAMRDRNRLLTEYSHCDAAWLDALEAAMAEHGAAIRVARGVLVNELAPILAAASEGPFARPMLSLAAADGDALADAAEQIAATLKSARARDAAAGRTLTGPHRDDLIVHHAAKGQAAARCSTGEQKALLLALVLAHSELVQARRDIAPVLLLDEVIAHLDAARREALFDRLLSLHGQIWMTGTEAEPFASLSKHHAQFIEIGVA